MERPRHLVFSRHAVERMFQRGISRADVCSVVAEGDVIAEYPDDRPFPSLLLLGRVMGRPLHVVVAVDAAVRRGHVVTAYEPAVEQWDSSYRRRRKP